MIDLHTHSIFSDGELIPAELARRAQMIGYKALALTDHADYSNVEYILDNLIPALKKLACFCGLDLLTGVELTHVPPALIPDLVDFARDKGAEIVLVHGETIVEPVAEGTNLAAIESGVDILAHPGLISDTEVKLAVEKKVALEISTRKGHSLTNGHVAGLARKYGANLVINNDAHSPGDLVPRELRQKIAFGCGLDEEEYFQAEETANRIVQAILTRQSVKES